jgi:kinesin family protein 1
MLSSSANSKKSWRFSEVRILFYPSIWEVPPYALKTARVAGSGGEDVYDPKVPPELQKVTYQTKDGRLKTVTKAELQEQMEASEKLMQSLNETWEEKMARTQEVQREREKALEELGITVEKNLVGVHTPKKVPTPLPRNGAY